MPPKALTVSRPGWALALLALLVAGCLGGRAPDDLDAPGIGRPTEFMLSFDDGPLPGSTERVLDALATLETIDGTPVKAGFFLLSDGSRGFWANRVTYAPYELWTKGSIERYPEIARRILHEGHSIGNHTAHHPWLRWPWTDTPGALQAEFAAWEATATRVLGGPGPRLFRPPYRILTDNLLETANRLGYRVVMGETVGDAVPNASFDSIVKNTESILRRWNKPYPCVLILHDNRPTTYEHLAELVEHLQRQGFELVDFDPDRL